MVGVNSLDIPVGLLKRGTIVKYNPTKDTIKVQLNENSASKGQPLPVEMPAPHTMFFNNGLFMGTKPQEGTPVVVGQGIGGQYYFVSFLAEDVSNIPTLNSNELLISATDQTKITLDTDYNIYLGSDTNNIHLDTDDNFISTNFDNSYYFTQAARKIEGVVKRDLVYNTQFSQYNKLESDDYNSKFKIIGMDPTSTPNSIIGGSTKNPPFIENREIIYEFQYQSSIDDDLTESGKYNNSANSAAATTIYSYPNRRMSRADTLSLSLVSPNYLMETVKGTVVDIFGNLLDLNRAPLPVGQGQNTLQANQSSDKSASFLLIKELERRTLAYHFEINARKNLTVGTSTTAAIEQQTALPDINSNADYSRSRSRFFIDIDKEGQFKINVPASSEKGNIPLLTRYENYSTFGDDDNGNPNKLVYRSDNRDIYQDSFASPALTPVNAGFLPAVDGSLGSINIMSTDGYGAPIDRITQTVIKHGMPYHDILQTCFAHQNNRYITYQGGEVSPLTIDLSTIKALTNIVSTSITIDGYSANAGGRSGSISMDGSLEFYLGANTVDRQSLWFDTAGGVVMNLGRDLNGRSLMAATGGDFYLQVGGFGVMGDSRFTTTTGVNNSIKGAILDLRILTDGGYCHMIRCDNNGISILTPGNLAVHAKGDMTLTSDQNIRIEAAALFMQERLVMKGLGGSI